MFEQTLRKLFIAMLIYWELNAGQNTGDPFTTDIKTTRRSIKAIGKNKSVGPDRVSGEILKLGGEAMILYLARLLDITMNNGTLPGD